MKRTLQIIFVTAAVIILQTVHVSAGDVPLGTTGTLAGKIVDASTKEPLIGIVEYQAGRNDE